MVTLKQKTRFKLWQGEFPKKKQKCLEGFVFTKLALGSFAISVATIISVVLLQNTLPPEIPLFYGQPRGEEQLASPLSLIIPSVVSFAILSINLAVSVALEDDFLKKALVLTGAASVFFSTITTLKIFLLVGSY